jgi:arylsulfatase A-like enzyme
LLKGAGYATACIGQYGVGNPESPDAPNKAGFDHFFGLVSEQHSRQAFPDYLIRDGKPSLMKNKREAGVRAQFAPDVITEDALAFIRKNEKSPFFLLVSFPVPVTGDKEKTIDVPNLAEFANTDWPAGEKAFAGLLRNIDRDTGRILDLLKQLKLDEKTLVLFTSANGPSSNMGHKADFFQSTGKHRGGKGDPFEGGIRVPTIAWWPGTVKAGSEDILQWYAGDLFATAAELAKVKVPAGVDSDSLVPALRGQAGEDRWKRKSPLYWESYVGPGWQIVRFGKWKAIRSPIFAGEIVLYDMSNDPAEKHNYAIRRPDLRNHANNLLNKHHQPDTRWKVE